MKDLRTLIESGTTPMGIVSEAGDKSKIIKLKAGKRVIQFTLDTSSMGNWNLNQQGSIFASGYYYDRRVGVDTMSKELFFFKEEVTAIINKEVPKLMK